MSSNIQAVVLKDGSFIYETVLLGDMAFESSDIYLKNVTVTLPNIFDEHQPLTNTNNLNITFKNQQRNLFLASPQNQLGKPLFRKIVKDDLNDVGLMFSDHPANSITNEMITNWNNGTGGGSGGGSGEMNTINKITINNNEIEIADKTAIIPLGSTETFGVIKLLDSDNILDITNGVLKHKTESGFKHIPSGGSTNQILANDGDGVAKWVDNISYEIYTSTQDALTKVPLAKRKLGMTLTVNVSGVATEYWFKNGVANADFVLKKQENDERGFIIKSQDVLVSTTSNTHTITLDLATNKELIWQTNTNTTNKLTTPFVKTRTLNLTQNNVVDCIYLTNEGTIVYLEGVSVSNTTQPTYPTYPKTAIPYCFVVFMNGTISIQYLLSSENIKQMLDDAKTSCVTLTQNITLNRTHNNKIFIIKGNVVVTIPKSLGSLFNNCSFYVRSGSLTLAKENDVLITNAFGLILEVNDKASLLKESPLTDEYIFS